MTETTDTTTQTFRGRRRAALAMAGAAGLARKIDALIAETAEGRIDEADARQALADAVQTYVWGLDRYSDDAKAVAVSALVVNILDPSRVGAFDWSRPASARGWIRVTLDREERRVRTRAARYVGLSLDDAVLPAIPDLAVTAADDDIEGHLAALAESRSYAVRWDALCGHFDQLPPSAKLVKMLPQAAADVRRNVDDFGGEFELLRRMQTGTLTPAQREQMIPYLANLDEHALAHLAETLLALSPSHCQRSYEFLMTAAVQRGHRSPAPSR